MSLRKIVLSLNKRASFPMLMSGSPPPLGPPGLIHPAKIRAGSSAIEATTSLRRIKRFTCASPFDLLPRLTRREIAGNGCHRQERNSDIQALFFTASLHLATSQNLGVGNDLPRHRRPPHRRVGFQPFGDQLLAQADRLTNGLR